MFCASLIDKIPAPILVTGANGFVGTAILHRLCDMNAAARGAVRSTVCTQLAGVEYVAVGELGVDNSWRAALAGMSTVIHTAARVHVMNESSVNPLTEFRRVNV